MRCWICGGKACTGEHSIKKSDLRAIFGQVSQSKPLLRHTAQKRNVPIKGLNVDLLKSGGLICAHCNNQRTQLADRAWEVFSKSLRSKPSIRSGSCIDLAKIFPGSVKRSMLNVHLYFVKLFGCLIAEKSLPIDIAGFSQAVLTGAAHPKVYLVVSPFTYGLSFSSVGYSDLCCAQSNGSITYATWTLTLDRFSIRIIYAEASERRIGLVESWHPSTITKRLKVAKL